MDNERKLIINALNSQVARSYLHLNGTRVAKSKLFSSQGREDGDYYWKTQEHDSEGHAYMLNAYSLAISLGPQETEELALAYYRRAMYFQHLNKYDEALNDIERALLITKSNCLKIKLYCAQTRCYADLERPEQKTAFEKVKFLFNKISDEETDKRELEALVKKLEKIVDYGDPEYARNSEKKKDMDVEEILSTKAAEDPFESLTIRNNKKDGRHLVAARDMEAGEIISVLKPYTINSNTELQPYLFCCHCMKVRWDSIPCNVCGWCFFCSDECRDEAWQQYHDIECAVIPMIRHTAEHQHLRQLTVRTVIKAVRQAGGILQLQMELQEVDKCSDAKTRGFSKNGKFENDKFISIYSLISKRSTSLAAVHVKDAVKMLIIFAKYTNLFGRLNKFKDIPELLANEDAIFIGSLILRLFGIFSVNYQEVWEKNPVCKDKHDKKLCFKRRCCYRTSMISPLFSLINHSCNPNAAVLYTDANKMMLVALKPIKKDDQIYQAYSGCGLYFEERKADREWMCKTGYNFTCECEACLNNWPLLKKMNQTKETLLPGIQKSDPLVGDKLKKVKGLLACIKKNRIQYDELTLKNLANAIEITTKIYAEPSFTISTLVHALLRGYRKLYLKKLRFPSYCSHR